MKVQTSLRSYHTVAGSHGLTPLFSGACGCSHDISGSARARLRSGVRAVVDSASTMLHQPMNGDARRRSGSSSKLRPPADPHSNGRQPVCHSGTRSCSSAFDFLSAVFTVARARSLCVPLSRSGPTRRRRASRSVSSDQNARVWRVQAVLGFCRTPHPRCWTG